MASIQPFDVGDITAEGVKLWTPSMVCKWVVSTAIDEDIGKHFVEHSINGELLLRLDFDDMNKLGIVNVGDEYAVWDRIEVLQRVCNKPGTRELKVPSWPMRLFKLATFAFADTSEGKSVEDMKNEIVAAHGNVAIVSTLVWAISFDCFYNCAYSTFCLSDANNPLPADHFCVTSGGFDLDGWRLNVFYCFSGLSAIFLLFSTVFAVIQIIMIFEMSDETELEIFLDLIGDKTSLPGIFLCLGIFCIPVPITLFLIWNSMHGCYFQTKYLIEGHPAANMTNLVMSYVAEGGVLILACLSVVWLLPVFIGDLYKCKVDAIKEDIDMVEGNFKDLDLGDAHF